MTEEVLTTPRKPLTDRQRLKLWEDHHGRCVICGLKIDAPKGWIDAAKAGIVDEHVRALGLGGSNDLANRGPAHFECAGVKTKGDIKRINKAKRQKGIAVNAKRPVGKMQGRDFAHVKRTHADRVALPVKELYR